jgi:hypothetical protein
MRSEAAVRAAHELLQPLVELDRQAGNATTSPTQLMSAVLEWVLNEPAPAPAAQDEP